MVNHTHEIEEKKFIEINPNLLAHNLKNAGKKRTKKNYEEEDSEGNLGERRPPPLIRMNERLNGMRGVRKTQHHRERKTLLREYRKKQEDLLNEGESLVYNEDSNRLILKDRGNNSSGFKINTSALGKDDDFMESVNFMKNLEEEIIEKCKINSVDEMPMKKQANRMVPDPDYGCLKNGSIPTFRQWTGQQPGIQRKTQRLNVRYSTDGQNYYEENPTSVVPMSIPNPSSMSVQTPPFQAQQSFEPPREPTFVPPLLTSFEKEAQEKAREINAQLKLKQMVQEQTENAHQNEMEIKGKRRRTIRRKLHTGKINDRVSILIPNNTIRNRLHNLTQKMNQTSIQEIKKYLLKRGFIKVGSNAPNEILRKMYQDLHMLGGEIQNLNGENIVYNFKAGGPGGNGDL